MLEKSSNKKGLLHLDSNDYSPQFKGNSLKNQRNTIALYDQIVNDQRKLTELDSEIELKKKNYSMLLTIIFTLNFAGGVACILYYLDGHYDFFAIQQSYQVYNILTFLLGSQAISKKSYRLQNIFITLLGISLLTSIGLIIYGIMFSSPDHDTILSYIFGGINIIMAIILYKEAYVWKDKLKLREELDDKVGSKDEDDEEG